MTSQPRYAFLDWLKCLGMIVIVYGHVAGWAPLADLPPIRLKQLGVALFLFALGYTLARDFRSAAEVVFKRVFEIYFFGLAVALLVSVGGLIFDGRWQKSNYLPFFGGINVLFDFFPANPTSWYIGTYVHFVVIGTLLLRRVRITGRILAAACCVEVLVRAVLIARVGTLVAYMMAFNWATVFLLGTYYGQRQRLRVHVRWWIPSAAAVMFIGVWLLLIRRVALGADFPFMLPATGGVVPLLLVSAGVSTLYVALTWLVFATVTNLEPSRIVRFIARNTMVIFLAHMPVYYALLPLMPRDVFGRPFRSAILMVVCLPGLALVSEVIHRFVRVQALRDCAFARLSRVAGWAGPAPAPVS